MVSKTTRQLNPIQLKKTIRPPSQKMSINCGISSNNNNNDLKFEYKEVYEFLKDLNMENYLEQFIKNGINTEEKILYLNNDNLKLIDIPYAHRARFLKKLKEIETMQMMKKTITEKGGLSKVILKKVEKNTKYEEIILPKEEDDIDIGEEEQRKTFAQAIFDYQKTHSKFENQDNINNNNELFATGINNMKIINKNKRANRYSDMGDDINSNETKNVNDSNKLINVENKIKDEIKDDDNKSKKSEGVGENLESMEVGEYIENNENNSKEIKEYNNPTELISGGPRVFFPLNKQKTLCYNCLHMILQEHCIQKFKKPFCSLHCLEIFEKKNVTNCNCCGKKIEIINSIPSTLTEKIYYCAPECLQKKEPNENMLINKSQIMEQNTFSPTSSETSENVIDILDL